MKKTVLAVTLLVVATIMAFAQAKPVEQNGRIKFEAVKNGDSYKMKMDLNQDKPVVREVKAVKVTCEPSGTVIFYISDGSLSAKDEESFLGSQKPVGKVAMTENDESGKPKPGQSLVEPKANYETKYPAQIKKDGSVKIEMLVLKDGKLQTHLVSKVPAKTTDSIGMTAYYSIK